jgi:hypothetical protein
MKTKTDREIYDQIDKANERINSGETDGFMTYEDGIKDALEWIMGNRKTPPMDEE